MGGECSAYGGEERHRQGFGGGNVRGRDLFDIPRCRWKDNVKMDLQEVGCGVMDWVKLA